MKPNQTEEDLIAAAVYCKMAGDAKRCEALVMLAVQYYNARVEAMTESEHAHAPRKSIPVKAKRARPKTTQKVGR